MTFILGFGNIIYKFINVCMYIYIRIVILFDNYLQGGPLLVISGVITPINGLINR